MRLARAGLAGLAVLLAGCSPAPAAPPTAAPQTTQAPAAAAAPAKVVIAYSEIYEGNIPLWLAKDSGILLKNGLDADLQYAASATAIAALLSDQIQLSNGGGSEALSANANGSDLVAVGQTVPVYPYVFEVTPDIKSTDDLRGKRIGISSAGSASDIATRVGLKQIGLDADKDVQIVPVGSSENRTAALLAGSIQGGVSQPPEAYQLEAQGLHPLFNLAEGKQPTANNTMVVKRSFLEANRPLVQAYVDSIVQAIALARKDRAATIQVMKTYLKSNDDQLMSRTYDYAFGEVFPNYPHIRADQLADSVDQLAERNPKVREVDISKMIDDSLVANAEQRNLAQN